MAEKSDNQFQAQLTAARRNLILDAAIQVFAEKGFHRATIKEVAKVAGIADGTIYNYFENKTALLLGILDRMNQTPEREGHFAQAREMWLAASLEEWVRDYLRQRFAMMEPAGLQIFQAVLPEVLSNEEVRRQYQQQIVQPTYELAERYFAEQIGRGDAQEAALTLRLVSGMFLGVVIQRLIGDPQLLAHWEELPERMADLILNGIGLEERNSSFPSF
jgi:TetR/AcrR family fatty acid metabolism transcriptional regulator